MSAKVRRVSKANALEILHEVAYWLEFHSNDKFRASFACHLESTLDDLSNQGAFEIAVDPRVKQ